MMPLKTFSNAPDSNGRLKLVCIFEHKTAAYTFVFKILKVKNILRLREGGSYGTPDRPFSETESAAVHN